MLVYAQKKIITSEIVYVLTLNANIVLKFFLSYIFIRMIV